MEKHSISTIISFCSLDLKFIKHCIEAALPFSQEIIIPICDHLYDGSKECLQTLQSLYLAYPEVNFIQFSYHPKYIYGLNEEKSILDLDWKRLQIASSRYLGYFFSSDSDYLLFLDSDEIIDTKLFQNWLNSKKYLNSSGIYFSAYAYFREPIYQSMSYQRTAQLIKKSSLSKECILNPDERFGLFERLEGKKYYDTLSLCQKPMIHHYGWARTQSELLKKTKCWGHHFERDWETLIKKEFSNSFSGKDFWSESKYRTLEYPVHNIPKNPNFEKKASNLSHVKHITRDSFYRLELQREFSL